MRELDDTALERRLREVLEEHLGALPLELTVETLNRRQAARGDPRRFGRGRGMTLLAAAALVGGGALAAGTGILRLPSVVPPVPSPSVVAVATTLPDATSPGPSESTAPTASPLPVAGPGGVWVPVGTMVTPGSGKDAVRLLDGRVLVVGSSGGESDPTTAQLYDPGSGTWSATGSMLKPRFGFPPTLLPDGRVLAGDSREAADVTAIGSEVYDPESVVNSVVFCARLSVLSAVEISSERRKVVVAPRNVWTGGRGWSTGRSNTVEASASCCFQ